MKGAHDLANGTTRVRHEFVAPEAHDMPSLPVELRGCDSVPATISFELCHPEGLVGLGKLAMNRTVVPEAGVEEYSDSAPRKRNVNLVGPVVDPIPQAKAPELFPEVHLPLRIEAADSPHSLAARFRREDVGGHDAAWTRPA